MLILVKKNSFAAGNCLNWHNLFCEIALIDGICCPVMWLHGKSILCFARDIIGFCHILCCYPHMPMAKRVGEWGKKHINKAGISHLVPKAHGRGNVRRAAHNFNPACKASRYIPHLAGNHSLNNRMKPRATKTINRISSAMMWQASRNSTKPW